MIKEIIFLLFVLPFLFLNIQCGTYPSVRETEKFKEYYVRTPDNWELVLSRLFRENPLTLQQKEKTPVILCHTLRVNDFIWALDRENSFAGYLSDNGFDVWMFSFRGFGKSKKVIPQQNGSLGTPSVSNIDNDEVSFDNLAFQDIPTVIDCVKKETGSDKVILIGHGFGANACAVYAAKNNGKDISSIVLIAPALVNFYKSDIMLKVGEADCPLSLPDNETMRLKAGDIVIKNKYSPSKDVYVEKLFFNRSNIDKGRIFRLYSFAVDVTPRRLIKEYKKLVTDGVLQSDDGKIVYNEEAKKIKTPTLVLSGMADNFTPPEAAFHLYRNLASVNKDYLEFSKANVFKSDYGHFDLIIGMNARSEVYPVILKWIKNPAAGSAKK